MSATPLGISSLLHKQIGGQDNLCSFCEPCYYNISEGTEATLKSLTTTASFHHFCSCLSTVMNDYRSLLPVAMMLPLLVECLRRYQAITSSSHEPI